MAINPSRHRFTLEEFHHIAEAGVFPEGARLELVDGEVTEMTPIGRRHAASVARIAEHFFRLVGDIAVLRPKNPIDLLG